MAEATLVNKNNEQLGKVELSDSLFEVEVKNHLLHEIVRMQRAKKRAGTACTKTRVEVRGGGAKPYRQKGTGRARAGSRRSPLWRGGGTVFGPKPRDYSYSLPKKVRRLGLRMALSARHSEGRLIVIDDLTLDNIKTRDFIRVMNNLSLSNALIVVPARDEVLVKSSRNVPGFQTIQVEGLNVYDILFYDNLLLLQSVIKQLEERLLP
ncbi:MAG: 50S ribosomal protein L4 [Thermodesulfobacteriota bacterium]